MTAAERQGPVPALSAVVVHWRNERELAALIAAWPDDPRFELLVVDNSRTLGDLAAPAVPLDPGRNLGFGGGVNHGVARARAPLVLMLNPDARPRPGALEALLDAFAAWPDAAGIVPALEGPDGTSQCRWQLRPLPSPFALVLQTLRLTTVHGPRQEPPSGTLIEQPAAAALALRRTAFDAVGGFDSRYHPAWFEDVDLARRLARAGHALRFAPSARFAHELGGSVPHVGYGRFLWMYYRHLCLYVRLHHGRGWAALAHLGVMVGMVARTAALPLRRPRQAASRGQAARALLTTAAGASSRWRWPRAWASPPTGEEER